MQHNLLDDQLNDEGFPEEEILLVDQLYSKGYNHFKITTVITLVYTVTKIVAAPIALILSGSLDIQLKIWMILMIVLSFFQSINYWRVWKFSKQMHYFLKIGQRMRHTAYYIRSEVQENALRTHVHPNIQNYLNPLERVNDRELRLLSIQIKYHFLNQKLSINIPSRTFFFIYQGLHVWGFFIFFGAENYEIAHHFLIIVLFLGTYQYLEFYSLLIIAAIAGPFLLLYAGIKYLRNKRRKRIISEALEGTKFNPKRLIGDLSCKICMQDYKEEQMITVLLCNKLHHFHSICLKQWIKISQTCPLCRQQIRSS